MSRAGWAAAAAVATLGAAAPAAHATLAYVKGALEGKPVLWVADDDGANARQLIAGGYSPKVSPDGTQVAFIVGRRRSTLKVKPAAGGRTRRLARNVWNFDAVQWSPDSTKLSVTTGPELGPYRLKLIDVATGRPRTLSKGAFYGVSFAPSGEGLVWSRSLKSSYPIRADLYTADFGSGRVGRMTSDHNATAPVWGPERIAFNRAHKPPRRGDYDKLDIYTILPDGSGIKQLTHTNVPFLLAGLSPLAWSADGRRLAAEYGGQDTSEVWRVNARNGKAADATGKFDGVVGWGLSRDGLALLATTGYYDNPDGQRRGDRLGRRAGADRPGPQGDPAELEPLVLDAGLEVGAGRAHRRDAACRPTSASAASAARGAPGRSRAAPALRPASTQRASAGRNGSRATISAVASTARSGIGTEYQPSASARSENVMRVLGGEVVDAGRAAPDDRRAQRGGDVVVVDELERDAGVGQDRLEDRHHVEQRPHGARAAARPGGCRAWRRPASGASGPATMHGPEHVGLGRRAVEHRVAAPSRARPSAASRGSRRCRAGPRPRSRRSGLSGWNP